jgi:hypothetical protein
MDYHCLLYPTATQGSLVTFGNAYGGYQAQNLISVAPTIHKQMGKKRSLINQWEPYFGVW